jgi:hypothetical protein
VGTSLRAVDDEVVGRLRDAIAAEDEDEKEQLNGVLRMLGAETPDRDQLPLSGKAPGEHAALDSDAGSD